MADALMESALYIGVMNGGATVPLLMRMLHVNRSVASGLLDQMDTYGIRPPYAAVEPDYEMVPAVRAELEAMLDRVRERAGLPPIDRVRRATPKEAAKRLSEVDAMTGKEFEEWCAAFLLAHGFDSAKVTQYVGDSGVDVVAGKDGERWAVQCKRYKGSVGNSAVQEVVAGMAPYGCTRSLIVTNSWFTRPAKKLAASNGTVLVSRMELRQMLQEGYV